MIQTILYFALGFLTACLVVMLVAPAVWRRAVVLTRKRIEASVPLTVDEILAAKDRLRAENAMTVRRLEMSVRELRQKVATQLADLGNKGSELRAATETIMQRDARVKELENELAERMVGYDAMESDLNEVSQALREAENALEESGIHIEELGRHVEAVSLTASNRQVDLAAREADIDRLGAEIAGMRDARKTLQRQLRDVKAIAKTAKDAARTEARRATELQKRLDEQLSVISDREERVERRERELARVKQRLKDVEADAAKAIAEATGADDVAAVAEAGDDQPRRVVVDAEKARLAAAATPIADEAGDGDGSADARKRVTPDNRDRIASLEKRVEALRGELEAQGATGANGDGAAALREHIRDIAAEMIHITTLQEGADSSVSDILASAGDRKGARASLADKVKVLQAAADRTERQGG